VFEDEKDFTLEIPINHLESGKRQKIDISDDQFVSYHKQTVEKSNGFCLHLHGATKPFFVNNKNLKVNAKRYKTHLEKALLPSIEQKMN